MAIKQDFIYRVCGYCGGDGVYTTTFPLPPYEIVSILCVKCNGKKGQLWGWVEKEEED